MNCPKCGKTPPLYKLKTPNREPSESYYIACDCGFHRIVFKTGCVPRFTMEQAINDWHEAVRAYCEENTPVYGQWGQKDDSSNDND